jgi:hypothetical protein
MRRRTPWVGASLRLVLALCIAGSAVAQVAQVAQTTGKFSGSKVNRGTVSFAVKDGKRTLTLSEDFEKPGTPDPHWQVVDSAGRVYPLQRLDIKDDRFNRSITLPSYVPDVAKVQIWCAFAETLLGEASFSEPVR